MDAPLIDIAGLRAERREADRRFLLSVPCFRLEAGDRVAVMGPSGSGKSTFLETVACARAPQSAERFQVRVAGAGGSGRTMDIVNAWAATREDALTRLRASTFGYVHQTGGLLDFLSVHDNIALTQRLSGRRDAGMINRLGGILGIRDLFASRPSRLSGGQRQRVAIARALAHRPLVVIADEPTAALDRRNARVVMDLLAEAATAAGAALLIATHDEALAGEFAFTMLGIRDEPAHGSEGADPVAVIPRLPGKTGAP